MEAGSGAVGLGIRSPQGPERESTNSVWSHSPHSRDYERLNCRRSSNAEPKKELCKVFLGLRISPVHLFPFFFFFLIIFLNLKHCISFAEHQNESSFLATLNYNSFNSSVYFYVCMCACMLSHFRHSLQPHGLQLTRPLYLRDSPGRKTGVGCHDLLQGIFPTQG